MKKWYVIQIKIKQEKIALENLAAQGYTTYNPMFLKHVMLKGLPVTVTVPLFSGYMFVEFDIKKDKWKSICNTQGVYKLLTAKEHSCEALPRGFIEEMLRRSDADGVVQENKIVKLFKDFHVGENVEIIDGPFKDFKGIVDKVEKNKISILFDLLGGKNSIRLKNNQIRHLNEREAPVR